MKRKIRPAPRLELLEDRCLLSSSPITPISLPPAGTPPSDTAAGASFGASISADGRFIAFESQALNLVPGQEQSLPFENVFLHDRDADQDGVFDEPGGTSTTLISSEPGQSNVAAFGSSPIIDPDGRFVAYSADFGFEIRLYDRVTGTNTLVNRKAGQPNTPTGFFPSLVGIGGNGRYVAFISEATDHVAGQVDTPGTDDLFLFDRVTGQITLVTHKAGSPLVAANSPSGFLFQTDAALSANGLWLTYASDATDLVAGQVDQSFEFDDVFLYDVSTGANTLVSRRAGTTATASNAFSTLPVISGNGRYVAYASFSGDLTRQVYASTDVPKTLPDLATATSTAEVSSDFFEIYDLDVTLDIDHFWDEDLDVFLISPSGTRVELFTDVGFDGDNFHDTTLDDEASLSINSGSAPFTGRFRPEGSLAGFDGEFGGGTWRLEITDDEFLLDGTLNSWSLSLLGDFFPGDAQVYLYDRVTGENVLVSHASDSLTAPADGESGLLFGVEDGVITPGFDVSNDGKVVFRSRATNLVPGQTQQAGAGNDVNVFLFDAADRSVTLVSRADGTAAQATGGTVVAQEELSLAEADLAISDNGQVVVFASTATNLIPGQNTPAFANVFRYQVSSGSMTLVSARAGSSTAGPDGPSRRPVITSDGRYIAFQTAGGNLNEVPSTNFNDRNGASDIAVVGPYVAGAERTTVVTRAAFIIQGDGTSFVTGTSADDNLVVFTSSATSLIPGQNTTNRDQNVYLYNKQTGTTRLVNHIPTDNLSTANAGIGAFFFSALEPPPEEVRPVISADGQWVAFVSEASNLVPGQTGTPNLQTNVFVYNVATQQVRLLSKNDDPFLDFAVSNSPVLSYNGRFVAFVSDAQFLIPGTEVQTDGFRNLYLIDRDSDGDGNFDEAGATSVTLVSRAFGATDTGGNGDSFNPAISDDGRYLTFESDATNLVNGQNDTNNATDVFVFDRVTGQVRLVSHTPASAAVAADGRSGAPVISFDGKYISFVSRATNLVPGQNDGNDSYDVFVYNVGTEAVRLVSGVGGSATQTGNSGSSFETKLGFNSVEEILIDPAISGTGRFVAFQSGATNLVPGQGADTNNANDVFLFDQDSNGNGAFGDVTIRLISHAADDPLKPASGGSTRPVIDSSGLLVAYLSTASNLVPGQHGAAGTNVFQWDRSIDLNLVFSGEGGRFDKTSSGEAVLIVLGRNSDLNASGSNQVLPGQEVFGLTYFNNGGVITSISMSNTTIPAGSGPGTVVGTMTATSDYAGQAVMDRVVMTVEPTPGTSNNLFGAGGSFGGAASLVMGNFTASPGGSYLVQPKASLGTSFAVRNFTLNVPGTGNRAPTGLNLSAATVPENLPAGTAVGTLSTTDPDPGDTHTYSLVPGAADNALFRVSGSTLQTNGPLDFEARSSYTVRVRTTDAGGLSLDGDFTITVLNVNEAPTGLSLSNDRVLEGQPAGTAVGTLSTADPEGGTFAYALVPGAADNGLFRVSGSTLETNAVFDFDARSSYTVRVRTTDAGGLSLERDFTIAVAPIDNRPPTDIALSPDPVERNIPAGTRVATLTASDPNIGETFTFALVPGEGSADNALFAIDGNALRTAGPLDASARGSFSVRVRVTDAGGLPFEKAVAFTVTVTRPAPVADTLGSLDATGVYNASLVWYLGANPAPFVYGLPGWVGFTNDWDGDGTDTIGAVDPTGFSDPNYLVWYLRNSNAAGAPDIPAFAYGLRTWRPTTGDWDGDGQDTLGVIDPNGSVFTWYLRDANDAGPPSLEPFAFGLSSWVPLVGDWDGDGQDTPGVYDPATGTFYLRNTNAISDPSLIVFAYGAAGWLPAVGDWDGDGTDTIAVIDPGGVWYQRNSNTPGGADVAPFAYGFGGWTPLPGRYGPPGEALTLAGPAAVGAPAPLGEGELAAIVGAALGRLSGAGVDPRVVELLAGAEYGVGPLPRGTLAVASPGRVVFSPDAAGQGWYIDPTPEADEEYAGGVAVPGSGAGGVDLLTAVLHEMGHLDGLPHGGGLMDETLAPGERGTDALDALFGVGL